MYENEHVVLCNGIYYTTVDVIEMAKNDKVTNLFVRSLNTLYLTQIKTGNMVSYTLSGFYIPRIGGLNVYETILPVWSWNNIFVILHILYKMPF